MNTIACAALALLAAVVALLTVLAWITESPADRARRWSRAGTSQRAFAQRLNVSRHKVKTWVTV